MSEAPPPWPKHGSRAGVDYRIFRVRHDELENPRTGARMERVVCETPPWVNVIALTAERELVMVHQYRFGIGRNSLEIPGGMVDPGEEHGAAARRELLEETGYEAETWTYLGHVEPNPALQDNLCHHWLAEGARASASPTPDPGEDLRVVTLSLEEVRRRIHAGEIAHSLVLTALSRVIDLRTHAHHVPNLGD